MTKPHEQEWTQGRDNWSIREAQTDTLRAQVYTDDQTASEADDVARFISAAPDMARALLVVLASPRDSNGKMVAVAISHEDWEACRAALRKAGVLP